MTETYNGPWNPVKGDVRESKQVADEVYHPIYPDTQDAYYPSYPETQPAGILENTAVVEGVTS